MAKVKNIRIIGEYRTIDMEQFARVLAMLVEERHRARLNAEREVTTQFSSPDTPLEP